MLTKWIAFTAGTSISICSDPVWPRRSSRGHVVGSAEKASNMTIEELQSRVGGVTGIPWHIAATNRRTPSVVRARWVMLYCLESLFPWMSNQEMARAVNRTCHGTAMHGLKQAHELYFTDKSFREQIDAVLDSK